MAFDFLRTLEDFMQAAKLRKIDDGMDSEKRRQWAILYTEAEKLKAYVLAYLVKEEE